MKRFISYLPTMAIMKGYPVKLSFWFNLVLDEKSVFCHRCKSPLEAKSTLNGNNPALGLERKIAYISRSPSD